LLKLIRTHRLLIYAIPIALLFCSLVICTALQAAEGDQALSEENGQAPAEEQADKPVIEQADNNTVAEDVAKGIKINKEKISLDLKGIEIGELIRILSVKMKKTIVPTKSVSGRINIFLNDLTFEDAFDIVLLSQDLACETKGDAINIMTASEYEKLYGQKYNEKRKFMAIILKYAKPATVFSALGQIKSVVGKVVVDESSGTVILIDVPDKLVLMQKVIEDIDNELNTEIFDLQYAVPADMKEHLSAALTQGTGEIYVDTRSSKVVISDLPDKMKKIEKMVRAFDAETKQVFIEAEVVQVTLKDEFQRGIQWEKIFNEKDWFNLDLKGTLPASATWTFSPAATANYQTLSLGTLARDKFTSAVTLLQNFGDTKIISSPKIAAINNQEAKILVGSREAYVTSSQSQAESTTVTSESVEFIDVGVKLNIVPAINDDGYITMKIKPEISSVRETLTTSLGSKIPIVETSEAETSVKVKNGAMVMIAGLRKYDKRDDRSGVPILGKIPILNLIFGARATLNRVTELIVFITPTIMSGDVTVAGTEPENIFPPDVLPPSMQQRVMDKVMAEENIKIGNPQAEQLKAGVNIISKAKGFKEY